MAMIGTILGITNWCINFIAILIFLSINITCIKYRRELRDISLILTYNTCLAGLLACLAVCVMTSSNLSNGFLTFNLDFCCIWGLLYDICQCSIYHSYYLQAFYRLCRVVFYKKKSLLSYSLFIMLIIGQWSITIFILLPPIFLKWYVHLPTDEYCLVPYTDLLAESYHISTIYMIPLVCITTVYIWITMFIRRSSRTRLVILAANQQQRNLRDLTVIKRIIILISILVALRFPTVIFMIYAVTVGHLYPFTFAIVGLITAVCMIFIGLMMIHITPQLRNKLVGRLIYRDNRVHTQQTLQQRLTVPTGSTAGHNATV
jgi:hypothetical protein